MTTQEAYEQIRAYFSKPKAQLARGGDSNSCFYRLGKHASNPVRCAFGVLIPDSVYEPQMDRFGGVDDVIDQYQELQDLLAGVDRDFLCDAQQCHDGARTVPEFLSDLDDTARDYDLTVQA